jgi:hypothetical protein
VRVCVCAVASFCTALMPAVPFRGGRRAAVERAAARQRAPRARMQSKLHQPPTTPCLYLAHLARCMSHFVVVQAAPSAKISALPIEPHTLVVAICLRLAVSISRGQCAVVAPSVLLHSMPVLPIPAHLARCGWPLRHPSFALSFPGHCMHRGLHAECVLGAYTRRCIRRGLPPAN